MFYEIELHRDGEAERLGTVPTVDDVDVWFSGAYAAGLLPDPPSYLDEIQVFEMVDVGDVLTRSLKWVWRLSWHQFEAKRIV